MGTDIQLTVDELKKLGVVKTTYTPEEFSNLGVIRISYNTEEIQALGLQIDDTMVITSFDSVAQDAKDKLKVDVPEQLQEGVTKWQLPIPKAPHQEVIQRTSFAPDTEIRKHSHPRRGESAAFRIVLSGSIIYDGKIYSQGDWFFIPPKTMYSFKAGADGAEVLHIYHAICPRFEIDPMK